MMGAELGGVKPAESTSGLLALQWSHKENKAPHGAVKPQEQYGLPRATLDTSSSVMWYGWPANLQ